MEVDRSWHMATLLADGRVMVAGGGSGHGARVGITSSCELYDPARGVFRRAGNMMFSRFKHSAVMLRDGRILFAGGIPTGDSKGEREFTTAELYDPRTGGFVKTGDMNFYRFKVRRGGVLLVDGKVLIAGGSWGLEIYDPATGSFSLKTGMMYMTRYYSTATRLPGGEVVIIGGYSGIQVPDYHHASASAWLYKPEK
jgi:hypothetical protein